SSPSARFGSAFTPASPKKWSISSSTPSVNSCSAGAESCSPRIPDVRQANMRSPGRQQLDLSGTVAVVTGGTRGVGLAVTRKLVACGAEVVAGYRDDEIAAKRLETEYGERVSVVAADLTTPAGLARLLAAASRRHRHIDVFVHAAGTLHPMPAVGADPAGVEADVRLALAPLLGATAITKLMPEGGRIILISSNGARVAAPRYVSAGIAKAAAESLVRYLAVELAGRGIAVNAI